MTKRNVAWRRTAEKAVGVRPDWMHGKYPQPGIPFCSEERCPRYDGKRCEALGHQPGRVCEPVVAEMAQLLNKVKEES